MRARFPLLLLKNALTIGLNFFIKDYQRIVLEKLQASNFNYKMTPLRLFSEPSQTSKMELFVKIVHSFQSLIIFAENCQMSNWVLDAPLVFLKVFPATSL